MIGPKLERLELNHIENIDKQFIVQVISFLNILRTGQSFVNKMKVFKK